MPLRTLVLAIVLGALAVFTVANWSVITAPTSLSLIFATVQAPLGLVLLGAVVLVTVVFLAFLVYIETVELLASRRQARELMTQREIAEKAEVSRYTELRAYLEETLQHAAENRERDHAALIARLDELEQRTKMSLEYSANSVAASIGELEDRLENRLVARTDSDPS